jgi:5-methylcytosine-specific restriction endonuclease McrA
VTRNRDYKKEYRDFHAKPEQKKNRAARNAARADAVAAGKCRPGDGKEVDHKVPLSKGGSNAPGNRQVISRTANRRKGARG